MSPPQGDLSTYYNNLVGVMLGSTQLVLIFMWPSKRPNGASVSGSIVKKSETDGSSDAHTGPGSPHSDLADGGVSGLPSDGSGGGSGGSIGNGAGGGGSGSSLGGASSPLHSVKLSPPVAPLLSGGGGSSGNGLGHAGHLMHTHGNASS